MFYNTSQTLATGQFALNPISLVPVNWITGLSQIPPLLFELLLTKKLR